MKLSTTQSELVAKLSIVQRAVSTRAASQALSGILISADGDTVTLRATDLEMGLQTELAATVEGGPFKALLPGRLLSEIARSLGGEQVELEPREGERDVEIRSGGSRFHLRISQPPARLRPPGSTRRSTSKRSTPTTPSTAS